MNPAAQTKTVNEERWFVCRNSGELIKTRYFIPTSRAGSGSFKDANHAFEWLDKRRFLLTAERYNFILQCIEDTVKGLGTLCYPNMGPSLQPEKYMQTIAEYDATTRKRKRKKPPGSTALPPYVRTETTNGVRFRGRNPTTMTLRDDGITLEGALRSHGYPTQTNMVCIINGNELSLYPQVTVDPQYLHSVENWVEVRLCAKKVIGEIL